MVRTYTLKRRADQQAETRRRIVEATVDLHTRIGPARTTLSMIAEQAGVQRHTLYAHFPEERDLHMACSALSLERDPLPEAAPWRVLPDPVARLRAGLGAIYAWYARNAVLVASVLRDAEIHPLTREIVSLRFAPHQAAWREILGEGLAPPKQVLLPLALSFFTWRSLVAESGLTRDAAVEAMVRLLTCES
jgi:AcrR family transcriptional regulator